MMKHSHRVLDEDMRILEGSI